MISNGGSILRYLYRLPIDTLKVAKEFVDNITESRKNLEIIKAIQRLAENFGLTILAEGVETREQFDLLVSQGCQVIQGYLISRPLSAEKFADRFLGPGSRP